MRRLILASVLAPQLLLAAGTAVQVDPARRDQAAVLTDGKGHYVALVPGGELPEKVLGYSVVSAGPLKGKEGRPPFIGDAHDLFYGDGKRWYQVRREEPDLLPGTIFRDPRYGYAAPLFSIRVGPRYIESTDFGTKDQPVYRGVDLRQFSVVYRDEGQAALRCGDRTIRLQAVDEKKGKDLLKAPFERSPRRWRPYALTRDEMGNYYYVDRGYWPEGEKQFRLFAGPKGALKAQKMTNVVSDSEGDIFSTKTGGLRLILGKQQANWIENDKSRSLTIVPVEKNLPVIWNELGVYAGEAAGTPCDIM